MYYREGECFTDPFNFDGHVYPIGEAALTHFLVTLRAAGHKRLPQVLQGKPLCHLDLLNQENQFLLELFTADGLVLWFL